MKRLILVIFVVLATCPRAHAYWPNGNCTQNHAAGGSNVTVAVPSGGTDTGDIIVAVIACTNCTDMTTTSPGWTQAACSGSNCDGSGNNLTWNTTGKAAVFWGIKGTAGSITTTSTNTGNMTGAACDWWGVNTTAPIDTGVSVIGTTSPSSSTTVNFPTFTPTANNELATFWGFGQFGTSSIISLTAGWPGPQGPNTCGQASLEEIAPAGGNPLYNTNNPVAVMTQQSMGPCAPSMEAASSYTMTGAGGNNIGIVVVLKPSSFAIRKHGVNISPPVARDKGIYGIAGARVSPWQLSMGNWYVDGIYNLIPWATIEPVCSSGSPIYSWTELDDRILNAQVLGENMKLSWSGGHTQVCSGASCPPTQSPVPNGMSTTSGAWVDNSTSPNWLLAANGCDNNTIPKYVVSINNRSGAVAPAIGNPNIVWDVGDTNYLSALQTMIQAAHARYPTTGARAYITDVNVLGSGVVDDEQGYSITNGVTSLATGGTCVTSGNGISCIQLGADSVADAASITSLPDWTSVTHTVGDEILPHTNNTSTLSFFQVTSCSGSCAAGTQPNWASSCATPGSTCTENAGANQTVWTNENQPYVAVNDGLEWGTLPTFSATTVYSLGQLICDGINTQRVIQAGTSGGSAPTWPTTVGSTVKSGTVIFQTYYLGILQHSYLETGSGCTGSDGTFCSEMLNGIETVEGYLNSAFPNADLTIQGYAGPLMPADTHSGGFFAYCPNQLIDPLQNALHGYNKATYLQQWRAQANQLGGKGGNSIFVASDLPYCDQPFTSIGFQTGQAQNNVAAANCNDTTKGNYSFSSTNCVPPTVYALLRSTSTTGSGTVQTYSMFPYMETFTADLNDAASQPWLVLLHQIAWGR